MGNQTYHRVKWDSSARSDRPDKRSERSEAPGECKGDTSVKRDDKSEGERTLGEIGDYQRGNANQNRYWTWKALMATL